MTAALTYLPRKCKRLFTCEGGVALLEFGIVLPILLVLATGIIEVTRLLLTIQKLEKTIILSNNIVTQHTSPLDISLNRIPISTAELAKLIVEVPGMVAPYPFATQGIVIITDVKTGASAGSPLIHWQYCGGGTLSVKSKIGNAVAGGTAAAKLPAGFTMTANEEVVIGEIFYQYTPLMRGVIPASQLYRTAIFMPRYETLSGLVSVCK